MRVTRAIAVASFCFLAVGGCAATGPQRIDTYTVRPQDTLYSIAWRHDLDYQDLARWNHIGSDYRLAVGQVLVLQGTRASAPQIARVIPPAQTQQTPPSPVSQPGGDAALQPPSSALPKWSWPTDRSTAPRPVPGGGVLLFGKLGQVVRAAAAGRVVYTGSGIRGYGNLIIIKHGDTWLSSYAHNSDILVKEGQDVGVGQAIAHMGNGPHQEAVLYFEIRSNGKPVDPLPYLAGR